MPALRRRKKKKKKERHRAACSPHSISAVDAISSEASGKLLHSSRSKKILNSTLVQCPKATFPKEKLLLKEVETMATQVCSCFEIFGSEESYDISDDGSDSISESDELQGE